MYEEFIVWEPLVIGVVCPCFAAAEIEAELEKDEQQGGMGVVPSVKHRDREYMGMLEYQKDDEPALIRHLITG